MGRRVSIKIVIALMLLAASATFVLSFFVLGAHFGAGSPHYEDVQRFREIREIISDQYVGEVDEAHLTEMALAATVFALGDRWSGYLNPEEYAEQLARLRNQQQGIGILFTRDEETNEMVVVSVTPGSPAEDAGLTGGDVIVALFDDLVSEMDDDEVRQIITDHFGDVVVLEVRGTDDGMRRAEVAVRDFIVNPVTFEMMDDNVGYIRIANFDNTSGRETISAIEALLEEGAEGLIFDVRSNPGGRVDELLRILNYLLPAGELFVFEDQDGQETVHFSGEDYLDMPMVVLVNEHSFSAAEFFAAILQEYDWAEIVGMPTSGKSRSQIMIPLMDGGAVRLSTSRYLTPGRVDLYEVGGIRPDYLVENEDAEEDLQLAKAIALLG